MNLFELIENNKRQSAELAAQSASSSPALPDVLGRAIESVPFTGVEPSAVMQDPSGFMRLYQEQRNAGSLLAGPITTEWMNETPENAGLVADEVPNIIDWELTSERLVRDAVGSSNLSAAARSWWLSMRSMSPSFKLADQQTSLEAKVDYLGTLRAIEDQLNEGVIPNYEMIATADGRNSRLSVMQLQRYAAMSPEERAAERERAAQSVASDEASVDYIRNVLRDFSESQGLLSSGRTVNFTDIRDFRSLAEWASFTGTQAVIDAGSALVIGAGGTLLAGPAGGIAAVFTYGSARGFSGITVEQAIQDAPYTTEEVARARLFGTLSGSVELVLGPSARFLRGAAGKALTRQAYSEVGQEVLERVSQGYLRRIGREVGASAIEEFFQEGAQYFLEKAGVEGEDFRWTDDTLLEAFNAAMAGLVGGGVIGGGLGARQQIVLERISRELRDAGKTVQNMEELAGVTENLQLSSRSPTKFKQLAERLGLTKVPVFFQAEDLNTYFQEQNKDPVTEVVKLGGTAEDFEAALASGGRVSVTAEGLARAGLRGADGDFLRENGSFTPAGATPAEAQSINQTYNEIQQQIQEQSRMAEMAPERRQVYDTVYAQLRAAGQSERQAEANAALSTAFFETMAARYGEDSGLEVYRRFGFRVEGPRQMARAAAAAEAAQLQIPDETVAIIDAAIRQAAAGAPVTLPVTPEVRQALQALNITLADDGTISAADARQLTAALQALEDVAAPAPTGPEFEQEALPSTLTNLDPTTGDTPDRISTRQPWTQRATEDPLAENLIIGLDAMKAKPDAFAANMAILKQYAGFTTNKRNPDAVAEDFISFVMDNLRWLYNQVPQEIRDRSKMWYDGARAITERWAADYGIEDYKIAGVLAALSPQKDWYQNVSLAERVLDIVTMFSSGNLQAWVPEPAMRDTAARIYAKPDQQTDVEFVLTNPYADMQTDVQKAMWVRIYDETYNPRGYRTVSSEGQFLGEPQGNVAWGSNVEIAKAIRSLEAATRDDVSNEMGTKHKVRNFFNNILAPNAPHGDVTIDTHAVAASLLRPLSGNSPEVHHNFGSSPAKAKQPEGWQAMKNVGDSGASGSYGIYAEAHRRLAEELGILPRQLQSITWEAVRGLFTAKQKSSGAFVASVNEAWASARAGDDLDALRERVLEIAGGINDPTWYDGPDSSTPTAEADASYAGELVDVRLQRRAARQLAGRDGGADGADGGAGGVLGATFEQSPAGEYTGPTDTAGANAGGYTGGGLAPLEGAPRVEGAAGPDIRLVNVAEKYAADNGIDLRRQAEFVEVDPERAARIAQAYEEMEHAPQDPAVQEAYQNLISQTIAQYEALVDAGYEFYFFDEESDPYAGNPWNAMRDLRANQRMAVFATEAGFGSGATELNVEDNPMLADTGIMWAYGSPDGPLQRVLANDLFRAVHDAFGHGLEGAGFRARGEENAWQAHVRLFTGSAVAAITTETRGQNSWLNYGPYGESNRTASVEDTVFADQKTGLMPEFTWTEGKADDEAPAPRTFEQRDQGAFPNSSVQEPVFHSTMSTQQFGEFDFSDTRELGVHFGSREAAENRIEVKRAEEDVFGLGRDSLGDPRVGEFYIDLQSPLRLPETRTGGWRAGDVYTSIINDPEGSPIPLTDAEIDAIYDDALALPEGAKNAGVMWEDAEFDVTGGQAEWMRQFLQAKGFDGIVYKNEFEGGGDSYIVFGQDQIRFADPTQTLLQRPEGAPAARGSITFPAGGLENTQAVIRLFESEDRSTFAHEAGHFFLEAFKQLSIDPNAPEGMTADFRAINEYLGRDPEDVSEYTVEQQETWARSFEAYIMEGKAPSIALRSAFERFKAWLTRIYRQVTNLQVELSPEIRDVMDRMLATEEELALVKAEQEIAPLFLERPAGMNSGDYDRYRKTATEADDEASQKLLNKLMARIRLQRTKTYNAERKALTTAVEEELRQTRTYQTVERLQSGDTRLNRQQIVDQFGEEALRDISRERLGGKRAIYAPKGADLTVMAELMGYDSEVQMLDDLRTAPKFSVAVELEVKKRLDQKYGDLLTDGSIKDAARAAMHSDKRGQLLTAEANQLRKEIEEAGGPTPPNLSREALKQQARDMIQDLTVRQAANPNVFLRAERKAAAEAQRAFSRVARAPSGRMSTTGAQDLIAAHAAKRRQLLNHYLYVEARKAEELVAKMRKQSTRLQKKSTREAVASPYIDEIYALLEQYDFRQLSPNQVAKQQNLAAFVAAMQAAGREGELSIDDRLIERAERVHFSTLTIDELQGLKDTLDNLEHLGRTKMKLLDAKRERNYVEVQQSMLSAVEQNLPDQPVNLIERKGDARKRAGRIALNTVLSADAIINRLDGSIQGVGAVWRAIKEPINNGLARVQVRKQQAAEDFAGLFKQFYTNKERQDLNSKMLSIPEIGQSLPKQAILAIALNTGNRDNFERLTNQDNAHSIPKDKVQAILDAHMDERDWRFVQAVWDYLDSYWPEIAAQERALTGVNPRKVDAKPQVTPYAFVKGGYYPIRYDPRLSGAVQDYDHNQMMENLKGGRFAKAQTRSGHTKERVSSTGQPLRLDLGIAIAHINDVIYDLEMRQPVQNTWRLLNDPQIDAAMKRKGADEDNEALKLWVQDVANGDRWSGNGWSAAYRHLRGGLSIAKMGFSITTLVQQPTGLLQSAVVIGKKPLAKALWKYKNNPMRNAAAVRAMSPFMEERQQTFQRDLNVLTETMAEDPTFSKYNTFKRVMSAAAFYLIQKSQFYVVDVPTWMAAYDKELQRNGGDADAAASVADQIVARAQGSGLLSDRTAFERGTLGKDTRNVELAKLMTTFGSYMMAKFSVATQRVRGTDLKDPAQFVSLLVDLLLLYTVETAIAVFLTGNWPDFEDEDEDPLLLFLAKETGLSIMSGLPLAREAASTLEGFGGGGTLAAAVEESSGLLTGAYRMGEIAAGLRDEDQSRAALKEVLGGMGVMFQLPTVQLERTLDGMFDDDMQFRDDFTAMDLLLGRRAE